jgi:hypothetical protein
MANCRYSTKQIKETANEYNQNYNKMCRGLLAPGEVTEFHAKETKFWIQVKYNIRKMSTD